MAAYHILVELSKMSDVRFSTFPRTQPPPEFAARIVEIFRNHETVISTTILQKGLSSNVVLQLIAADLVEAGFTVEQSKASHDKIKRPVFFGENGQPGLQFEIDAFHPQWKCGLEVEAGRAWLGNAVYRDLIQALVMVDLEHLALAVPNGYRRKSSGRTVVSRDYESTCAAADALFGHSRIKMPYSLMVIGY